MKKLIYFEWLHFSRNIARPIALLLFILAGCFGVYNGVTERQQRIAQQEAIDVKMATAHEKVYEWFESETYGAPDRPWVNVREPLWSMWYAGHHLIDNPEPAMVFNLGQSAHFGYYKAVSMMSTAFDSDLTAEIANPELVQTGALDFTFVWLYLMPLLLVVLTFHIKGLEHDLGFLPLIKVQKPSVVVWLAGRLLMTGLSLVLVLSIFLIIPALVLADLQFSDLQSLWPVYALYLLLWLGLVYLVILFGNGQADQALKLVGIWLIFTVVVPGAVSEYVLLQKPAGLMVDMIDAGRDGRAEIYERPKDEIVREVISIVPELKALEVAQADSLLTPNMINMAYSLVFTYYMSDISNNIIAGQQARNQLIASTYWFNPVTGFHNWLNDISETSHKTNLKFRKEIQNAGETINRRLVIDDWQRKEMDKASFDGYVDLFDEK